jgi:hypothetical protein
MTFSLTTLRNATLSMMKHSIMTLNLVIPIITTLINLALSILALGI